MQRASIIQSDRNCWLCKKFGVETVGTDRHHALHGTANRKLADQDGLTVYLCRRCHAALHDKGLYDRVLQQEAQKVWMEHNGKTVDDFIKRYGKSYL